MWIPEKDTFWFDYFYFTNGVFFIKYHYHDGCFHPKCMDAEAGFYDKRLSGSPDESPRFCPERICVGYVVCNEFPLCPVDNLHLSIVQCYTGYMTGRTHDLAAFSALGYVVVTASLPHLTIATGLVSLGANLLGGLAPDLDQPTSKLWRRLPAGSLLGRIVHPFFGSHRLISHSLLGVVLFGFLAKFALSAAASVLLVNMQIVWWAFMIGYVSHVVMDTFTKEGVPWLFPLPWKIGFPPFKLFRITTGGLVEKGLIFPGLLVLNGYIYWAHYHFLVSFLRRLLA